MKQRNDLTRRCIESREIRPLLPIAVRATEGQIVLLRRSTVLFGENVIDLKRLGNPTLPAACNIRTAPRIGDESAPPAYDPFRPYAAEVFAFNDTRALDWRIAMRWLMSR
jgi:hypothetical protein